MADEARNPSKENLAQIRRDTAREAHVQPGPGQTTNEADMQRAEGLEADPKVPEVAENYEVALETGANQEGEGRIVDR